MKLLPFMAPFVFCSLGIIVSSREPVIGLIISSLALPLWFFLRWMDPETKQQNSREVKHE